MSSFFEGDAFGGIHDLAGNVSEWTGTNDSGLTRVFRGGSWSDDGASGVFVTRDTSVPMGRYTTVGFRCVR